MTKLRPTKEDLLLAVHKAVPDVIASKLSVLFCGINPGLYTAAVGHHFARPGNRFWKALYEGGFTPRLLDPSEERELLKLGYGITNIVPRATARAAEISHTELISGLKTLRAKLRTYKPQWIAFLGMEAYKKAFGLKSVSIGRQDIVINSTKVWVLPNPSGLNANFTPKDFAYLFKELKEAID